MTTCHDHALSVKCQVHRGTRGALYDLQVEPGEERYFITSCSDNSIALFDLRKMGKGSKPAATARHSLTCQSAFFAPDGASCTLNGHEVPLKC